MADLIKRSLGESRRPSMPPKAHRSSTTGGGPGYIRPASGAPVVSKNQRPEKSTLGQAPSRRLRNTRSLNSRTPTPRSLPGPKPKRLRSTTGWLRGGNLTTGEDCLVQTKNLSHFRVRPARFKPTLDFIGAAAFHPGDLAEVKEVINRGLCGSDKFRAMLIACYCLMGEVKHVHAIGSTLCRMHPAIASLSGAGGPTSPSNAHAGKR